MNVTNTHLLALPTDALAALVARLERAAADLEHARGEADKLIEASYLNALADARGELARRFRHQDGRGTV